MATSLPAVNQPVLEDGGALTVPFRRLFEGLWRRSGASREITLSAVDDVTVRVSLLGTDGVTRSVDLTVS